MAACFDNAGRLGLLLATVVLGVAGCGDGADESPMNSEPDEHSTDVRCGRPFDLPAPGELQLAGRFPDSVPADQQTVSGTLDVTSRQAVRGVAAPAADLFLVRDDLVVTTPMAQDAIGVRWELAAGESRKIPATASLVSCEPEGAPLPPGAYDLYARVVLTPDDGTVQTAFGGPWPLRLR